MRKIGVLTSGGDSPGMNAAVMSVARSAALYGIPLIGIKRGYNGLLRKRENIKDDLQELNLETVLDIADTPGTYLRTARCDEFREEKYRAIAVNTLKEMEIDGLVVIGGDGSFNGARCLCEMGIPCVGIPGTIDNDLGYTEMTLGYDTAVNVCVNAVRAIRATSRSHDRPHVVEVMGRHCGDIALHTGIAVGATSIIVPEIEYDLERDVIARIYEQKDTGKKHFIIIVAEGVGGVQDISHYIQHRTGIETRATILGHVQRGGSPSLRDRLMATDMGVAAVHLLAKGIGNRVIASQNGKIVDYDITEALEMPRVFDDRLYKVAMEVSI